MCLQISNAYGSVKVQVKGAGYALLQMQAQYGVDRDRFITEPPVQAFTLVPQARYLGRNASLIEYHICQQYVKFMCFDLFHFSFLPFLNFYALMYVCIVYFLRWTYLEESERSGMAVLEVTVPTGYFLHQKKLDDYVKYGDRLGIPTLRRARYFPEKVFFYFDYVSSTVYFY